jgi:hypothetical protein
MPIFLSCSCGKRLQVPEELAGKKVRCPGCNLVLAVPPPQFEIITAVAVPNEAVVPAAQVPPLPTALNVPPVTNERSRLPKRTIELAPVGLGRRSDYWLLEMSDEGMALIDDNDKEVMKIERVDVSLRLRFPSFWQSIKYIEFLDSLGKKRFEFEPDKEAIRKIRAYQDRVLRADPEARRKYKQRSTAVLLAGLGTLSVSGIALLVMVLAGWARNPGFRGVPVTIIGMVLGLFAMGMGLAMYLKAARLDKEET